MDLVSSQVARILAAVTGIWWGTMETHRVVVKVPRLSLGQAFHLGFGLWLLAVGANVILNKVIAE